MYQSDGDNICHFGGVRLRVTGSGILRTTLKSLDEVNILPLATITMAATRNYSPFLLANMVEQAVIVRIETTSPNETFKLNRIVVYMKTIYTMRPG